MFEIGVKIKVKSGEEVYKPDNLKQILEPYSMDDYDEWSSRGIGIIKDTYLDINHNLLYRVSFENPDCFGNFYAAELIKLSDISISIF